MKKKHFVFVAVVISIDSRFTQYIKTLRINETFVFPEHGWAVKFRGIVESSLLSSSASYSYMLMEVWPCSSPVNCDYQWRIEDWSSCSRSCNSGIQVNFKIIINHNFS